MPPKRQKTNFSEEMEIMMAGEVERRPALWDSTQDIYRRADLKLVAYAEIASALNNPAVTGKIVADRWKTMRSTFMENERRLREFKKKCSGSGTEDVYTPKWSLYKHLLFLKKITVQAESSSNLDSTFIPESCSASTNSIPSAYLDDNLNAFIDMPEDTESESLHTDTSEISEFCGVGSPGPFSPPVTNRLVNLRPSSSPPVQSPATPGSSGGSSSRVSIESSEIYKKRGGKSKIVDEAVQLMRKLADEPSNKAEEDSAYIFGCLVAQRLREIENKSDIGARRKCEFDIMSVLTKY